MKVAPAYGNPAGPTFLMMVTSSTSLGSNRWRYSVGFATVYALAGSEFNAPTPSATTWGYGYNIREWFGGLAGAAAAVPAGTMVIAFMTRKSYLIGSPTDVGQPIFFFYFHQP